MRWHADIQKKEYAQAMNNLVAKRQARLFYALMHPVRLQILDVLRAGEECVCHLEAHLGQRQAYISQQLAILRKAGLVTDRRDGPNIFYRISGLEVLTILDTARAMTGEDEGNSLSTPISCPCPRCSQPLSLAVQPAVLMIKE
jgi:ArsR family transcriptional regulator